MRIDSTFDLVDKWRDKICQFLLEEEHNGAEKRKNTVPAKKLDFFESLLLIMFISVQC